MKKVLTVLLLVLFTNIGFADETAQAGVNSESSYKPSVEAQREISQEKSAQPSTIQQNAEWQHHQEFLRYLDTHDSK